MKGRSAKAGGLWVLVLLQFASGAAAGGEESVFDEFRHLRNGEEREWANWPESAAGEDLEVKFLIENPAEWRSLVWRQDGVKQGWEIVVNGNGVGRLISDDKYMRGRLELKPGALRAGENQLVIRTKSESPDDIRVGEIQLWKEVGDVVRNPGNLSVAVTDGESGDVLPSRITVVDSSGSLALIGAASNDRMAVRSGVVYTADGVAEFALEAGRYTIYGGRGFEYGIALTEVEVKEGGEVAVPLEIHREVDTAGWVACDPHLHSLTFAGHGDATFTERVIALAGEGIELPISTEHNQHVDFRPEIKRLGLEEWMTPVVGNEVTTDTGHFNIWPVAEGAEPPLTKLRPWKVIFKNIFATPGVKVCMLNHPSDVHRGFHPFGREHFVPLTGENLDGWKLEANAVEIVNSGALNHDPLEAVRGWMGLLNSGHKVTPVGASDSHSVSFSIAGQGRTYIRGEDSNAGDIDVDKVTERFLNGDVTVSMGLFAEMRIEEADGTGDRNDDSDKSYGVEVTVRAPSWSKADRVLLFANGTEVGKLQLREGERTAKGGLKWTAEWDISPVVQDTAIVAVALGPGISKAYWPSKHPYQRESAQFSPYVMAVTGVIWLDGSGDEGELEAPLKVAQELVARHGADSGRLFAELGRYDSATAAQVAMLLRKGGKTVSKKALQEAPKNVTQTFRTYSDATGWGIEN